MKTRIHHWLVACILILSSYACQKPANSTTGTLDSTKVSMADTTDKTIGCDLCDSLVDSKTTKCSSDRYVKVSCAMAWIQKWEDSLAPKLGLNHNIQRTFSKRNLNLLHEACDTCDMRIYFGLEIGKTDTSAVLVLANVAPATCDDQYMNGKVLVHRWIGDKPQESFEDTSVVRPWVTNWSTVFYTDSQTDFLPTVSQTMMHSKFWAIVDSSQGAISCDFAIHKVDSACGLADYGPWPKGPSSRFTVDVVISPDIHPIDSASSKYLDFARPCPHFCRGSSLAE